MGDTTALKAVAPFLQLLFQASKVQARALLETVDLKQIRAVREIIFNVLNEQIPLTESQQESVKNREKVLQRIVLHKGYQAGDVIARHHRIVYETLCMVHDHILQLL